MNPLYRISHQNSLKKHSSQAISWGHFRNVHRNPQGMTSFHLWDIFFMFIPVCNGFYVEHENAAWFVLLEKKRVLLLTMRPHALPILIPVPPFFFPFFHFFSFPFHFFFLSLFFLLLCYMIAAFFYMSGPTHLNSYSELSHAINNPQVKKKATVTVILVAPIHTKSHSLTA